MRLLLLFFCCEWTVLLHWRCGLAHAFALLIAYLPKSFLLTQIPLNPLYAVFLQIANVAFMAQFLLAALLTIFGGLDSTYPGGSVLNLFRKPKFTWLILEPLLAVGFAAFCAVLTLAGEPPVLLPFIDGQSVLYPEAAAFWHDVGSEGRMIALLLVPFISAFVLLRYNRLLYARTDLAFAEAAGMSGARPPKKPPAGAMIAGSAITFPKVKGVSRKADAPSLKVIGRSFR